MPDFSRIEEVQHKIEAIEIQKQQTEKDLFYLNKERSEILKQIRSHSCIPAVEPLSLIFSNGVVYRVTTVHGHTQEITKEATINLKNFKN